MKFLSAMRKELLEIMHDRTMLAVLVIFPIFIMAFMGSSFRSMEIVGLPIGVAGAANTTFAAALFSSINESHAFNLQGFPSEAEALDAFRNGRLRAVIVVPPDFDANIRRGSGSEVRVLVDNSDLALEQAMLAAMSSVIEASSVNITKGYVYSAWEDLKGLNASAASLSEQITATKSRMEETKTSLAAVRGRINELSVSTLEETLGNASSDVTGMRQVLLQQKGALANISTSSGELFSQSDAFLANATGAINQSIASVDDTHSKLASQVAGLNNSLHTLDASIAGLELIKNATPDNLTKAALDLNLAGLRSLRNDTAVQMANAQDEMASLRELNATLQNTSASLADYAASVSAAKNDAASLDDMETALNNAAGALDSLNTSFSGARAQVRELKALLADINSTSAQIEGTLDAALAQASSVETLIASLEGTVAEQTGKDPALIASPLSVKVEGQYARQSFVDFIMPQVISVSLLFSCFLLGSVSLVRERTRKTIIRALLAPDGFVNLVAGKIATLMLLSFGQIALILVVASLVFGVRVPNDWALLMWGTAISSLVLSSIGVLIGFYARSESSAIQGCLLIAIPMLFLGNIVFSPDLLPAYTQVLQQALPLAHVTSIFKVVLVTGGNPAADVMALLSYFILLMVLLAYVLVKRRDISNYT
ncbi:MAG: ABC transporter permease [Candidatus ainarchaeum sp.]|nr:ABC transporter permease [Candidatus ainarchaeum sp.]